MISSCGDDADEMVMGCRRSSVNREQGMGPMMVDEQSC
jgi:hypothetical protein